MTTGKDIVRAGIVVLTISVIGIILYLPTSRLSGPPPPVGASVEVFFGTDRLPAARPAYYGTGRANGLQLGSCIVRIPPSHRTGVVERPSIWRLEFGEDPNRHMVIDDLTSLETEPFLANLKKGLAGTKNRELFVFVHGFNVVFADAVLRTAQIAFDLQLDAVPVTYSWPSRGELTPLAYTADEQASEKTLPQLEQFLTLLAAEAGVRSMYVLAHSMGNRPVVGALRAIRQKDVVKADLFKEVALTAPDIDADVFIEQIAPTLAHAAKRVTVYASSNDRALQLSKTVHNADRLGDSGERIVVVPGIDTIDVSALDTSFVGHSEYGDNRSVIADLFNLFHNGLPPVQRFGLVGRQKGALTYWVFRR